MKPAAPAPVLHCPTCYSTSFQVSRVRPDERLRCMLFKRPVRCTQCNRRIYASRSYARWLLKERSLTPDETPGSPKMPA